MKHAAQQRSAAACKTLCKPGITMLSDGERSFEYLVRDADASGFCLPILSSLTEVCLCRSLWWSGGSAAVRVLRSTVVSGVAELKVFAVKLLQDAEAMVAATILPYSQGQIEGRVTKRSMYGRGKFDLLRYRALYASAA